MRELIRSLGSASLPTRRPDPEFIAGYAFPPGMLDRALTRCPPSVTQDVLDVGLRQFFLAAAADPDQRASMPSRVVDEAWHEFITFTRAYEQFCLRAFGRFLHHEPEYLMNASLLYRVRGKPRSTLEVAGSGQRCVTTLPRV